MFPELWPETFLSGCDVLKTQPLGENVVILFVSEELLIISSGHPGPWQSSRPSSAAENTVAWMNANLHGHSNTSSVTLGLSRKKGRWRFWPSHRNWHDPRILTWRGEPRRQLAWKSKGKHRSIELLCSFCEVTWPCRHSHFHSSTSEGSGEPPLKLYRLCQTFRLKTS